jgi:hypothetical protein
MSEKVFKVSVSDWEITFDTDEIVKFTAVISEDVFIRADGKSKVKLTNADFDPKFIDLFKKDVKVKEVKQSFQLINSEGSIKEMVEYNYLWMTAKNVHIISAIDGVATVTLVLEG